MNRKQFVIVAVGMIVAAFAGGIIGSLVAAPAAAADAGGREIIATKIKLVDDQGRVRAALFTGKPEGACLAIYNQAAQVRMMLAVDESRSGITLTRDGAIFMITQDADASNVLIKDSAGKIKWLAP